MHIGRMIFDTEENRILTDAELLTAYNNYLSTVEDISERMSFAQWLRECLRSAYIQIVSEKQLSDLLTSTHIQI